MKIVKINLFLTENCQKLFLLQKTIYFWSKFDKIYRKEQKKTSDYKL